MLQTIRDRASGWIAYVIVGLLIVPFALWGINSYFGNPDPVDAAVVGDRSVSLRDFQQAYRRQQDALRSTLGSAYDPARYDTLEVKREVLQQLIDDAVLARTAEQRRLRVGDLQLSRAIRTMEAFQQDGVFNNDSYQRILQLQGYTPVSFEQLMRQSLTNEQLRNGVIESAVLPNAEVDRLLSLLGQKREIAYLTLSLSDYLTKAQVDEAAIESYYQENQASLTSPEQIEVNYLELSVDSLAEQIPVDDDQIKVAYDQQQSLYNEPERRSASHILVPVPEDADPARVERAQQLAADIYATLSEKGRDFDTLAARLSDNGLEAGELGVIEQGLLDPTFEQTLYGLAEAGAISEPIRTPFGYQIIRLDNITPAEVTPLDEVRDDIARQLKMQQAESEFYDVSQTLAELAYEQPDSLQPAADALGLEIQTSAAFGRSGGDGIAAFPQLVETAFSPDVLSENLNSAPIEIEPGRLIVVHLRNHLPSQPLPLDEARSRIEAELQLQQANEQLATDSQAILERVRDGETLEALAEEYQVDYQTPGPVTRAQSMTVPAALLTKAFKLPVPDAQQPSYDTVTLLDGSQSVLAVLNVEPGEVADVPEAERANLVEQLTQQIGFGEYQNFVDSLREQTEVTTYIDRL